MPYGLTALKQSAPTLRKQVTTMSTTADVTEPHVSGGGTVDVRVTMPNGKVVIYEVRRALPAEEPDDDADAAEASIF